MAGCQCRGAQLGAWDGQFRGQQVDIATAAALGAVALLRSWAVELAYA
ncbi:MAG: hypothetical protein ACRDQW_10640 [Haloechinothrix sp.]